MWRSPCSGRGSRRVGSELSASCRSFVFGQALLLVLRQKTGCGVGGVGFCPPLQCFARQATIGSPREQPTRRRQETSSSCPALPAFHGRRSSTPIQSCATATATAAAAPNCCCCCCCGTAVLVFSPASWQISVLLLLCTCIPSGWFPALGQQQLKLHEIPHVYVRRRQHRVCVADALSTIRTHDATAGGAVCTKCVTQIFGASVPNRHATYIDGRARRPAPVT